jgi:hypothetical protein
MYREQISRKESLPGYYGKKWPSDRAEFRPTAVALQLVTCSLCPYSLCAQFFPHSPYTEQVVSRGIFCGWRALVGLRLLVVVVSRSHSDMPHSPHATRVIGSTQRPLPDNTHTNSTHNRRTPMPLAGFEPAFPANLRPRGHWDPPEKFLNSTLNEA